MLPKFTFVKIFYESSDILIQKLNDRFELVYLMDPMNFMIAMESLHMGKQPCDYFQDNFVVTTLELPHLTQ